MLNSKRLVPDVVSPYSGKPRELPKTIEEIKTKQAESYDAELIKALNKYLDKEIEYFRSIESLDSEKDVNIQLKVNKEINRILRNIKSKVGMVEQTARRQMKE